MVFHSYALARLIAATAATPLAIRAANGTNDTMAQSWDEVPVAANLTYVPCFSNFSCANLEVPFDYDDTSAGTTNIAFVKYSSPNQPAMGDIIFNPGGPGGSGVEFVLGERLALLTGLLGDSYNIVGMDPRGVNNSGPNVQCFKSGAVGDVYLTELFRLDSRSEDSIRTFYQASGAYGDWCSQALNDTAKYVNTPATARDMLQYAEKLAESKGEPCEDAKVDYYGASYGSALGTTFASLFPDRVGRFIIDAVVDVEDYYFGNWSQNILQADAAMDSLSTFCFAAKEKCPLYKNDASADAIKARVDAILADIDNEPIAVSDPNLVQFPTTITVGDVQSQILLSVYNAIADFPSLALTLADLENRNGSLAALLYGKGQMPLAECDGKSAPRSSQDPKVIIACNDNNHHYEGTEENLFKLYDYERGLSKYVGDIWPPVIVPLCRNLTFAPPENQLFKGFQKVNTSTPILFADNTIDPVSSSSAKMSAFYENSVLLLQDAVGHGLIVTLAECTTGYVQNYLKTGELPPAGTICEVEEKPFLTTVGGSAAEKRSLAPRNLYDVGF